MTTHTLESLMSLATQYHEATINWVASGEPTAKARAALSAAIAEVLAELDFANNVALPASRRAEDTARRECAILQSKCDEAISALATTLLSNKELQSKVESQAAEIERLQEQCNERGRLAIDNGIRMERAEAKVAELESQEPVTNAKWTWYDDQSGYFQTDLLHPPLGGMVDGQDVPLYLASGAAPKETDRG